MKCYIKLARYLSFSQSCCWWIKSPGVWRCDILWMVTQVASTSVTSHHPTPRNIPDDRMPQPHRGGSLKNCKFWKLNKTEFLRELISPHPNQGRGLEAFLWLLSEVTFSGRPFPHLYWGHCGNLGQSNSSLGCESDSCPRKGYQQWRNTTCTQALIVNNLLKGS
jgi:hypothetical protein